MSKRQLLLDAALDCFVEQGIDATATARIAKRAGVANGTLFHHFPTKQDLVNALYAEVKQRMSQQLQEGLASDTAPLQQRARILWFNALDWLMAHPKGLRFVLQVRQHPGQGQRLEQLEAWFPILVELIEQGQHSGALAPVPRDLALALCENHLLGCAQFFQEQPDKAQQPEYRNASFNTLWHLLEHS
ncbi:TetR/AcrR family transcriptional regulator [Ferrimonas marina]|uniref:Transcriptional regulator, TetR family n=1 Tax=Ferrimonas marina TaxID=299255 RepID=A0A1M5VLZ3_9GAMM|nr:TetR/AcrR family transcriptional regulator [Ferrimonas marina]SHH76272.1 transcriptional regulator, TetR family [Ferrimonas marina]